MEIDIISLIPFKVRIKINDEMKKSIGVILEEIFEREYAYTIFVDENVEVMVEYGDLEQDIEGEEYIDTVGVVALSELQQMYRALQIDKILN